MTFGNQIVEIRENRCWAIQRTSDEKFASALSAQRQKIPVTIVNNVEIDLPVGSRRSHAIHNWRQFLSVLSAKRD